MPIYVKPYWNLNVLFALGKLHIGSYLCKTILEFKSKKIRTGIT